MKYKIGKYVVDAKSPIKAHQAVKLIKQHTKQKIKDARYKLANDLKKGDIIIDDIEKKPHKITEIIRKGSDIQVLAEYLGGNGLYSMFSFDKNEKVPLKDSKIKDATKRIDEIAEYFRVWGYPARSELQEVVDFYKLSKNDMKKIFGTRYDEADLIKLKYHDSKVKDYKPPFAVWVKENGKWKIYSGSNSENVDRNAFLAKGYEDVKVVKNGDDVKDSKVKDEAFDRQTIEALISDEQAAIDSYNVAIANLKGKLSDEAIKVLQAIRDDEQNHVANLNAILSNNITEKNLEDSVDDASNQEFYEVTRLAEEIAHKANKEDYQAVGNLCYNLIQYLKSHKLAK